MAAGGGSTGGSTTGADSAAVRRADAARILGDSSARVWVVMISDYQCPFCKQWHDQTFEELRREYVETGKVRMAYVNFPLPSHRNAWPAAQAAMCAGAQGKFWPMHDAIFTTQERWASLPDPSAMFDSLATAAGIDATAMRACVRANVMRPLIQADYERSAGAGVNSTPTFVIGDSVIAGAYPIARFRTAIEAALRKSEARN